MIRKFTINSILFCIVTCSMAQSRMHDKINEITPFMMKSDYKTVYKKSLKLLNSKDSSDLQGVVNYFVLFSAGAMVSTGEITLKEFEKRTKKIIGLNFFSASHIVVDSGYDGLNAMQFYYQDSAHFIGFSTPTTIDLKKLIFYQYFYFSEKPNLNNAKSQRCNGMGKLTSIEVNTTKNGTWVAKLIFTNSRVRIYKE